LHISQYHSNISFGNLKSHVRFLTLKFYKKPLPVPRVFGYGNISMKSGGRFLFPARQKKNIEESAALQVL